MLFSLFKAIAKPFAHIWYKLSYEGVENVPKTGRVIVAANHQHAVDPGLIGIALNRSFAVMAKQELFNNKFNAWLLGRLGAFPTKRTIADVSAIEYAVTQLRGERLFMIFPEGTRCPENGLQRLKSGVVAISAMAQAPIVPCTITAPEGVKRGARIVVRFGEPIQYWELGITEFSAKKYRAAKEMLRQRLIEQRDRPIEEK